MQIKTNKVTNCVVYVDGESFLGRAEEVTTPEVAPVMVDHKGLGLVGKYKLPVTAIEEMSAKIKWNAIYPEVLKKTHNPFKPLRLQIRGNVDTFEGNARTGQIPVVIIMSAAPKKPGGFVFKPADNVEREDEFNVTMYGLEIEGEEIVYVDVMNNIWRVNGEDILATYRENIGQ